MKVCGIIFLALNVPSIKHVGYFFVVLLAIFFSRVSCLFWPLIWKKVDLRIEKKNETKKKKSSPTGNRTPVSRVTGGDTYHYTIEEADV